MSDIPRPSLVALFEHYGSTVHQRVNGQGWQRATCPLHPPDNAASAEVNEELGKFRCHHAGESGDAIDLVQELEAGCVGFSAARARAAELVEELGGDLPAPTGPSNSLLPGRPRHRGRGRTWRPPWKRL